MSRSSFDNAREVNLDEPVKRVTSAKAGVQANGNTLKMIDSGFRRNDEKRALAIVKISSNLDRAIHG
jgi:hypothetical protein